MCIKCGTPSKAVFPTHNIVSEDWISRSFIYLTLRCLCKIWSPWTAQQTFAASAVGSMLEHRETGRSPVDSVNWPARHQVSIEEDYCLRLSFCLQEARRNNCDKVVANFLGVCAHSHPLRSRGLTLNERDKPALTPPSG
jgi:hypothetical protein